MLEKMSNYLYLYVVDRDFGFAPNPFHGVCTLATCKPKIRKFAKVGDWIIARHGKGIIVVSNNQSMYKIFSGNLIKSGQINDIKKAIDQINRFDKIKLRELYKQKLANGRLSNKGGAGLGFIDMARKTGGKIDYDFIKINNKLSLFVLKLYIKKL